MVARASHRFPRVRLTEGWHMICGKVKSITEKRIADIRRKVNELKRLERVLSAIVTQCRGDDTSDCPILDALAT